MTHESYSTTEPCITIGRYYSLNLFQWPATCYLPVTGWLFIDFLVCICVSVSFHKQYFIEAISILVHHMLYADLPISPGSCLLFTYLLTGRLFIHLPFYPLAD